MRRKQKQHFRNRAITAVLLLLMTMLPQVASAYDFMVDDSKLSADYQSEETKQPEVTITIGNGTIENEGVPIVNWQMLSYIGSECLYVKDQLASLKAGDKITSIAFYLMRGSAQGGNFNVRLKNTSISSLKNNDSAYDTSCIEVNYNDQVYGNVNIGPYSGGQWIYFPLSTPFVYYGENIIIDIRNTKPGTRCGWCYFATTAYKGVRRSLAWHHANSEDPHTDGFNKGDGGIYNYDNRTDLPNIKITYTTSPTGRSLNKASTSLTRGTTETLVSSATTSKAQQQPVSTQKTQEIPKETNLALLLEAKKNDPIEYFNFVNDKRYELFEKSQLFYLDKVKPIFDELETIPEETSEDDVAKMRQDLSDAQNRLNILMPSSDQFNSEIASYLTSLLSSRCNPQAIALVKDLDNSSLSYQLSQLKNYEYYSNNMRDPLEHVKAALEQNGWKKLKESDAAIRIFDKEWENTIYLNSLATNTGDGIPFLNDQMKTIMALRMKGFDSKDELLQVIDNLTPSEEEAEAATRNGEIIHTQNLISSLENQLRTISDENEKFNELDKQRYEVTERWYDMREELDKLIMDACKYTVSHPCDGMFVFMVNQIDPMLNSVYHKSYKARKDSYVKLFNDYERHTSELEAFLKRIYPYVRTSGGMSADEKNVIQTTLQSLDYYSNYYAHRNEKNAVTSPYLDGVIAELENMLANNFTGCMDKYNALAEKSQLKCHIFAANGVKFAMIQVEGGTFTMGATPEQGGDAYDDEKPAHSVTLSSFSIGQTEVTQELWQAVMGNNPSDYKGNKLPVEQVSWDDCQKFIKKLNQLTGQNFRLPTEAEWEYAARGGVKSQGYKYAGSNNIGDVAWYDGNSGSRTHAVATKRPNELGLHDMSGNVWEWCYDWFGDYSSSAQTNPLGPTSGSYRVYRGGCWGSGARGCRVAYRNCKNADRRFGDLGFRLAL